MPTYLRYVVQSSGFLLIMLTLHSAVKLQQHLASHYPNYALMNTFTDQNTATLKKVIPTTFHSTVADLYWIRFIQYNFDHMNKPNQVKKAMQLVLALDPYIGSVYQFTATNYIAGMGAAVQPHQALTILNQGLRAVPRFWVLYQIKASTLALYEHDYPKAQQVLLQAMRLPHAPAYLANTLIYYALRNRDEGLIQYALNWQAKQTLTPEEAQTMQQNQQWLDSARARQVLAQWVNEVKQQTGVYPVNRWQSTPGEQIDAPPPRVVEQTDRVGRWETLPLLNLSFLAARGPDGYPYQINTQTGEIRLSPFSPLFSLDQIYQAMYVSPERIQALKALDLKRQQRNGAKEQHERD